MNWSLAWGLVLAVVVVLEFIALIRRAKGDTASEQIWSILRNPWFYYTFALFWVWLTIHLFFLPPL